MKSLTHEEMEIALHKEDYSKYLTIKTKFDKPVKVLYVPSDLVENTIYASCDGLEDRVIAKDLLYKFNEWLMHNKGRRVSLDSDLVPHTRSWFKQFEETLENYRDEA